MAAQTVGSEAETAVTLQKILLVEVAKDGVAIILKVVMMSCNLKSTVVQALKDAIRKVQGAVFSLNVNIENRSSKFVERCGVNFRRNK